MNLEDVLKALKSSNIEPKNYGYNRHGGAYDCFYIENGKYYHSYPDDFDRMKELIIKEIESEHEFIKKFLINIRSNHSELDSLVSILLAIHNNNKDGSHLNIIHTNLFELYGQWFEYRKDNPWKFCVLSAKGELFNKIYCYGIGYIDGKYIVEQQGSPASGDRANGYYYQFEYDNFYEAFIRLKRFAEEDILWRQRTNKKEN